MTILHLEFVGRAGARTESFMELEDVKADGGFLLTQVELAMAELLPDAVEPTAWFVDKAGLRQRLQEASAPEAVSQLNEGNPHLMVFLESPADKTTDTRSPSVDGIRFLILHVFPHDGSSEKAMVKHLEMDAVEASPEEISKSARGLAGDMFPAAADVIIRYQDEEGDRCTLTDATSRDAASLARLVGSDLVLQLYVEAKGTKTQRPQITHTFRRSKPAGPAAPEAVTGAAASALAESRRLVAHLEQGAEAGGAAAGESERRLAAATAELEACRQAAKETDEIAGQQCLKLHDQELEMAALRRQLEAAEDDVESQRGELEAVRAALECAVRDHRVEVDALLQVANDAERAAADAIRQAEETAEAERNIRGELERTLLRVQAEADGARQARTEVVDRLRRDLEERSAELESLRGKVAVEAAVGHEELASLRSQLEERTDEVTGLRADRAMDPELSARILLSTPSMSGIELTGDDAAARADITQASEALLARFGAQQVFRVGRVCCALEQESVPVVYTVTVLNSGKKAWPETTMLVHASGDNFGLPVFELGPVEPGNASNIFFELSIPRASSPSHAESAWILRDVMTGKPLGPVLLFEVEWLKAELFD